MTAQTDMPSKQITSSTTLLVGWRLRIVWAIWIAIALMTAYETAASAVKFIYEAKNGGALTESLALSGIEPSIFFPLEFVMNIIQQGIWWIFALFIVWKRRDDWMVLVTSLVILLEGYFLTTFVDVTLFFSLLAALAWILDITIWGSAILFFGTFPDGRFAPRWLKPIFIALFVFVAVDDIIIMTDPAVVNYSGFSFFIRYIVIYGLSIFAQLYRLRRASPIQRQQTKLAVAAMVLAIAGVIVIKALLLNYGQATYLIVRPIAAFFFISSAVCFIYAILRRRLWDIDFAINRSLVYGGLTVLLGAVFAGGFFGLRTIMESLFGNQQDLIAIAVPAVVITALFTPTRNRLQRYVDQRFYGIEIDYKKAMEEQAWRQKQAVNAGDVKTSFDKYTNLELIGRGGMGEVYRTKHPTLNCDVAIKILPKHLAENEAISRRYDHEVQAIAQLKHPNIVGMYDYGIKDGMPYIVLEYIDGQTLSAILNQQGRLSLTEALPLFTEIASALDFSHAAGIVHRDIKPSNVMIERDTNSGKNPRAVLMDFGIAKLSSSMTQLTGTGVLIGTLDYVSPEQIRGDSEVDAQADIYSFGVMVYQALTGALPFEHKNISALLMAHLMRPVSDPREKTPDLSEAVAKAIMKAMSKEPHARQKSAGDFVTEMAGREIN